MHKMRNKLMIFVLFMLFVLTACTIEENGTTPTQSANKEDNAIHLNLAEADLIANITDNEKYLNPDLLYDIDGLEDSDNIGIIVALETEGLADYYLEDSDGFDSIADFSKSSFGISETKQMHKNQQALADLLLKKGLINEVKHSYTTLLNGFSAQTTYGKYKEIVKLGLASCVSISEVYALPKTTSVEANDGAIENIVDVYETGIFNSSNVKYTGENTAVAVLDSGFDVHHTVFQNMPNHLMIEKEDVKGVLNNTAASSFTEGLKVDDVYVNAKIPYAYDYADKDPDVTPFDSEHGTHVAGIIGGKDEEITGVAINTQLVLLKVFSDLTTGAKTEDILAALEDAVTLGVDAINMSLGSSCGFSEQSDNAYLMEVYDKIEAAGISLVVAASNDYSSAYGGEESNTNKVTNPDSATVGSPSTYTAALSVASISGTKSKYIKTEEGYVFFFNEANNASAKAYDFYEMMNLSAGENRELEYVTIPGYGSRINYSNIDVSGKVALVKRGDISFEEKARFAAEAGAVACIVYNNIGGDILMSAGNDLKIPFCSISKDDGEYLASRNTGVLVFNNSNLAGPFMSDFSSWGPNPDLSLKPEITAHGGNIKSAIPGGGYDELSGTSMASPNMCGIVVLIRQYLKEKFPEFTTVELSKMTNELLMSCATIALDQVGNPYSPRKQGAGLASLYNAVNTKAYLTVDGIDRTKIELGDDPEQKGEYTLKFNVNNLSNTTLYYSLKNYTMTESVSTSDRDYVAEKAYMLDPETNIKVTGDGSVSNNKITVQPNGCLTIEYTLTLNEADKHYIRKSFKNGMYVEGFAQLVSENEDGINLSVPFLAFFGDWTLAPMFDKTFYEVESEAHDAAIDDEDKIKADYYATTPLGTYYYNYIIPLGSYVYLMDPSYDPIPATEEHAAMGYSADTINGITCVYAGLLRNAKKMTTTITNSLTGEVVYEHVKLNQFKAHYSGGQIPSYDMLDISISELGLENNTKYTFKMEGELDYKDGGIDTNLNNSFSFSFYVDYEPPILKDAIFRSEYDKTLKENRYYIDVYVYDNHYTQSVRPFTLVDGALISLCENPIPVYGEKGTTSKVTLEITDCIDLLQYSTMDGGGVGLTNGLGIMVDDYAMNSTYCYVSLPGTNATDLEFVDENDETLTEITINVGEEVDLTTMLHTNDDAFNSMLELDEVAKNKFLSTLYWKSSNERFVQVKNGKIEGIAAGTSAITVTTVANDGYEYSTKIIVKVEEAEQREKKARFNNNVELEEIKFVYFDTLKAFIDGPEYSEIGETGDRLFFEGSPTISFYPSEKVQLGYEITPWNLDPSRYTLSWSSTQPNVASVGENGVVTALKEGSATITLRITVDGKQSNLIARARVNVKNEFIVEGRTLTGYKGFGGDVVIPDDLGIMYIGSFSFALYTTDMSIKVDENDWDANKTAGGNTEIKSVTIPADVMEIQKYAFYNCPNLEKVTLLSNGEDTCDIIREYAFANDTSLSDINLGEVRIIGKEAFKGCTALTNVDFSSIYALGEQAFKGCIGLTSVDLTTLRNAWPEVFLDCINLKNFNSGKFTKLSSGMFKNTGLESVSLQVDRIPDATFAECKKLNTVVFENDLIYVGANAFEGCNALVDVNFNGACEFIYSYAFSGATKLKNVSLPNSEVTIEQYAFFNCQALNNLYFNEHTQIVDNLGTVFEGCDSLSTFDVDINNPYYSAEKNLLMDKTGTQIVLAAPNYVYRSYTIPSNITHIRNGAFSGIDSLSAITFGSQVEEIGDYAFAECLSLTTIIFPANDVKIGEGAFEACTRLRQITNLNYVQEIGDFAFSSTALTTIKLGDNTVIGDGSFAMNSNLKLVNLGDNTTIGYAAFMGCSGLTQVNATGKFTVDGYAFYNCAALSSIPLNNAFGAIGEYAFYSCKSLLNADLLNVTSVGDFAFADCSNIRMLNVPIIEYIGDAAFGIATSESESGVAITSLVLPDTLYHLGEAAFYGCLNLTSVTIPNVNEFGGFEFANCLALTDVTLSQDLKEVSDYMFYYDTALMSINLDHIEKIGDGAFYGCLLLEDVNLEKVISIGDEAFYSCTTLTKLNLENVKTLGAAAFLAAESVIDVNIPVVQSIGEQALSGLGIVTLALPDTLTYVAPTAFYGNESLTAFVYLDNGNIVDTYEINDCIKLINGAIYTKTYNDKQVLSSYPAGKLNETFEVADGTVRIEIYAGADNPYVKTVILPDSVQSIGNMAFNGCTALETVEFKSTVAPTLEGSLAGSQYDYSYEEGSPVYELFNKYLQFNGYYPLYYGQFKAMVGMIDPLNIILPKNVEKSSYENVLYELYFDVANATISQSVSKDKHTIAFLELIKEVPTDNIKLSDEQVVVDARTEWNAMEQKLTDFGYLQSEVDAMLDKLSKAETAIYNLKHAQINAKYAYLNKEMSELGTFDMNKLDDYALLIEELFFIDKNEKRYLDTSIVDEFGKDYSMYIDSVLAGVNTLDSINTFTTEEVSSPSPVAEQLTAIQQMINQIAIALFVSKKFF